MTQLYQVSVSPRKYRRKLGREGAETGPRMSGAPVWVPQPGGRLIFGPASTQLPLGTVIETTVRGDHLEL